MTEPSPESLAQARKIVGRLTSVPSPDEVEMVALALDRARLDGRRAAAAIVQRNAAEAADQHNRQTDPLKREYWAGAWRWLSMMSAAILSDTPEVSRG